MPSADRVPWLSARGRVPRRPEAAIPEHRALSDPCETPARPTCQAPSPRTRQGRRPGPRPRRSLLPGRAAHAGFQAQGPSPGARRRPPGAGGAGPPSPSPQADMAFRARFRAWGSSWRPPPATCGDQRDRPVGAGVGQAGKGGEDRPGPGERQRC